MARERYIIVYESYMSNLCLEGIDLLIYSYITGFNDTEMGYCKCSIEYIANFMNVTTKKVHSSMKKLIASGFIQEVENDYVVVGYKSTEKETESCIKEKENELKEKPTLVEKESKRIGFIPPTVEQVQAYLDEKHIRCIDAEYFVSYYESRGWLIGKNKIKNWKSCVQTWVKHNQQRTTQEQEKRNANKPEWLDEYEKTFEEGVVDL